MAQVTDLDRAIYAEVKNQFALEILECSVDDPYFAVVKGEAEKWARRQLAKLGVVAASGQALVMVLLAVMRVEGQ